MRATIYDRIAPYYDLLHRTLTEDVGFILTLAGRTGGPILELGCGTGRLLVPLARAGYTVTGLDNSRAMLSRAQRRLSAEPAAVRRRIHLIAADVTTFALAPEHFTLALVPYNPRLHLDPATAVAACRAIARHLTPNARLFLDLPNPHLLAQTPDDRFLTLEATLNEPETGDQILVLAANRLEEIAQQLHITWIYDVSPAAGGAVHRTVVEVTYHYYFLHQLELLLEETGFSLEAVYGGYNHTPFSEESERLLLLGRKRR